MQYESRYELDVQRPHVTTAITRDESAGRLLVHSDQLEMTAKFVVSATGSWTRPFWPAYPGARDFEGRQLHTAQYRTPEEFEGRRVIIVGGGNSGAQILAEVSKTAATTWVTARAPRFLPDDVDGRVLLAAATARIEALRQGHAHAGVGGLGDIVMVASVRDARARGRLDARPMFARLTRRGVAWDDGTTLEADAIIWATGFRPELRHLHPLRLRDARGRLLVEGPTGARARGKSRLHLLGYGDWTGPASATLLGVGRSARAASGEIRGSPSALIGTDRPDQP